MKIYFYTGDPNQNRFLLYIVEDGILKSVSDSESNKRLSLLAGKECPYNPDEDGIAVSAGFYGCYISFKLVVDQCLSGGRKRVIFGTVEELSMLSEFNIETVIFAVKLLLEELSLTASVRRIDILRKNLYAARRNSQRRWMTTMISIVGGILALIVLVFKR